MHAKAHGLSGAIGTGMSAPATNSAQSRWACHPDWEPTLKAFFATATGQALRQRLAQRRREGATLYPPQPLRALWLTPPSQVRVVIVGQDPYHQPGQAHGLAFSVAPGVPRPPSLRNILQEVARDCGGCTISDGCLEPWALQGVLLLNTVLTVEPSAPACHAGWGWEALTDQIIQQLGQGPQPLVFMLWGAHAQAKKRLIDSQRHAVLSCNHPSPLAAHRPPQPFVGCGHFSQANRWLQAQGFAPILW